ncbi:hypothetical protein LINGRAPRIM_LOCUS1929 [Linum grandiflorum]
MHWRNGIAEYRRHSRVSNVVSFQAAPDDVECDQPLSEVFLSLVLVYWTIRLGARTRGPATVGVGGSGRPLPLVG